MTEDIMKFIINETKAKDPQMDSWNFIDFAPVFKAGQRIASYNAWNKKVDVVVKTTQLAPTLHLPPESRIALPTGVVVEDLPEDHILEVSINPGHALQRGLHCPAPTRVMNGEQVFINVHNISDSLGLITSGEWLGMGRLVHIPKYEIVSVKSDK